MRAYMVPAVLVAVLISASCNLVVYDEEGIRAARRADEMDQRRTFEITDWNEYAEDVILHPQGFLPDSPSGTSGYLITRTVDHIVVIRVEGATVTDRVDIFFEETRGAFQWSARVVPVGTSADPAYAPPLVLAVAGDDVVGDGSVTVTALYPEPGTSGRLVNRGVDFPSVLAPEGFPNRLFSAVQCTSVLDAGGAGEFQLLAWEDGGAGVLQEFFVTVSGDELVRWDHVDGQSDPALLAYTFVAGSATFPRPQRSDGYRARSISYANARLSDTDPNDRRGYLTFADGDYTAAPLITRSWLTDVGAVVPVAVDEWQYPFHSVTAGGILRNASTGTIFTINARAPAAQQTAASDHGALWYAGQYPEGGGTVLVDIYTAVGLTRGVTGWKLSIGVYEE